MIVTLRASEDGLYVEEEFDWDEDLVGAEGGPGPALHESLERLRAKLDECTGRRPS